MKWRVRRVLLQTWQQTRQPFRVRVEPVIHPKISEAFDWTVVQECFFIRSIKNSRTSRTVFYCESNGRFRISFQNFRRVSETICQGRWWGGSSSRPSHNSRRPNSTMEIPIEIPKRQFRFEMKNCIRGHEKWRCWKTWKKNRRFHRLLSCRMSPVRQVCFPKPQPTFRQIDKSFRLPVCFRNGLQVRQLAHTIRQTRFRFLQSFKNNFLVCKMDNLISRQHTGKMSVRPLVSQFPFRQIDRSPK